MVQIKRISLTEKFMICLINKSSFILLTQSKSNGIFTIALSLTVSSSCRGVVAVFKKKKSIISFFCHAWWKVLINRATVHVKNLIVMMTFISFFLDMQFPVQATTNFELWLVNVVTSYQVMLRTKMGILFWLVHIQRNKLRRKALNEKCFCVRMHRAEIWSDTSWERINYLLFWCIKQHLPCLGLSL